MQRIGSSWGKAASPPRRRDCCREKYVHSRLNSFLSSSIRSDIQGETENLQWAAAGSNVTISLVSVDPVHLNIGSVLCPTDNVIPLATTFTARIIIFDVQIPITAGSSVIFHNLAIDRLSYHVCANRSSCFIILATFPRAYRSY
jgi:hypothetical protein